MEMTRATGLHRWWHLQWAYLTTVKALERALAPLGLTPPQMQALRVIAGELEPVTPSRLALALALESQSVTGLLDRLEARGWVTRRRDLPDRRVLRLHLTDAGQAALQAAAAAREATLPRVFAGFSTSELDELTELLGRLVEHAQRVAGPERQ